MSPQVGHGEVAIVPTIKGFRRAVGAEVDGATKEAAGAFSKGFASAGAKAGNDSGRGFHAAFSGQTDKTVEQLTASMRRDVAKAATAVSQARIKEQDSAGKVRLAETQLGEARAKYAGDSSQVVRAEERLQSAQRELASRQEVTRDSTAKLKTSQSNLAEATERVEREMRDAAAAADHAGDEFRRAGSKADAATGEMSRAGAGGAAGFMGGLKGGLGKVAGVVGVALIAADLVGTVSNVMGDAVRAAVGYVQQSVVAGSGLSESLNAVKVSFGEAAAVGIGELSKLAAQSKGLSQLQFNEIATQFSAFAKTIRSDDVVGFIDELTTRGSDFASVYNIEVSDALALFQSGLAGETEPLRKYGIDLSAAAVEAYALAKGIGDGTGALSEAEKQQARYGLLMESTAQTAGDFNNTSDELANKQRILNAEWENSKAKLGESLLPALTDLANIANEELVPVLNDVIDKVGPELGDALKEAAPAIGDMLVELAPLLPELVTLATEGLPPLVDLLTELAPLIVANADDITTMVTAITGFIDLLEGDTTFEDLGTKLFDTSENFRKMTLEVGRMVGRFQFAVDMVKRGADEIALGIAVKIQEAINWITSLPSRAVAALGNVGSLLTSSGRALIGGFIDGIEQMVDKAGQAASNVISWVLSFFPNSPAERGPLSGPGWSRLRGSGEAFITQWTDGAESGAKRFSLPDLVRQASVASLSITGTPHAGAIVGGSGGVVVQADVNVQTLERDPRRVGREIIRGVVEAVGAV